MTNSLFTYTKEVDGKVTEITHDEFWRVVKENHKLMNKRLKKWKRWLKTHDFLSGRKL